MNKRILVTGAAGQLGKTIEELFFKNNLNLDFVFVTKAELDITNYNEVKNYFNNNNFDYCINCAAYTNVEQAERTPKIAFNINAYSVKYLAKLCRENNIILIHISTDYVFDGEKDKPYTTTDATNPINEYGKSKLLGEKYIMDILKKYFIIRTSWLYSKKYGNNFYKTVLKKAEIATELSITTEQTGCPTDTVSLSNYIINTILKSTPSFGIYHFCGKKPMTWYDFTKQILLDNNLSNKINLVKVNNYCTFARRPKFSVLENTK
ncbi:dTDP-4-dehydrorhamnose reductase [Algibacter marinivivus]|uniref:dTDP-4-dehydrorhamnose reductase n=1 Tax=Algibacter marinivivus TaxID=2100723 RepID=A0A2U2X7X8_9FLAO|nr:dTDP-4-dehydrorhamnose reductase [Algibacter marinivivus]PWH83889.1 dTDP-4-dehydrorhamnose reductase [Algibacter marinivivus]